MPAGLLGELAVNLVARTQKFEQGMKKGRDGLKRFEDRAKQSKKVMQTLRTAIIGVGSAFAVGKLFQSFKQTAESIDELTKTAQRLNITTEALSRLSFAADRTGVSMDHLKDLLKEMQLRMAEARQGNEEYQKAFTRLGIDLGKIAQLPVDQQFSRIAESLRKINDQDQIFLANKIFGEAGAQGINLFEQGAAGLAKMAAEADRLGKTITDQEAAKFEKFNDEMGRLSTLIGGFKQDLVIAIGPGVTEAVEGLRFVVERLERFRGDSDQERNRRERERAKEFRVPFTSLGTTESRIALASPLGVVGRGVASIIERQSRNVSAGAFTREELTRGGTIRTPGQVAQRDDEFNRLFRESLRQNDEQVRLLQESVNIQRKQPENTIDTVAIAE